MKKLKSPLDAGFPPFFNDDIVPTFQDDIYAVLKAIIQGIQANNAINGQPNGMIVSGCVFTPNGGNPANWDVTSGIVFLDGEFLPFAGATNVTTSHFITRHADVVTQRTWEDTTNHDFIINKYAVVTSTAGTGNAIAFDTTYYTNNIQPYLLNYIVGTPANNVWLNTFDLTAAFAYANSAITILNAIQSAWANISLLSKILTGTYVSQTSGCRYKIVGKTCYFDIGVTVTTSSSAISIDLSSIILPKYAKEFVIRDSVSSIALVGAFLTNGHLNITKLDGSALDNGSHVLAFTGVVELA